MRPKGPPPTCDLARLAASCHFALRQHRCAGCAGAIVVELASGQWHGRCLNGPLGNCEVAPSWAGIGLQDLLDAIRRSDGAEFEAPEWAWPRSRREKARRRDPAIDAANAGSMPADGGGR